MSPTVFREGPYRFYFNSREEDRLHVHIEAPSGELKIWLEPRIEEGEKGGQISTWLSAVVLFAPPTYSRVGAWRFLGPRTRKRGGDLTPIRLTPMTPREEELIRETSSGAFAPLCNERPGAGGVRISPEPTAPFCSAMPSHAMLRQTTEVDPLRHSSSLPSGVACMLGRSNRKELS
jgi:hypothetical protein